MINRNRGELFLIAVASMSNNRRNRTEPMKAEEIHEQCFSGR